MKDHDIIKAVAELDGLYFGTEDSDREECWRTSIGLVTDLPNYLTSLDAIVPVIRKQPAGMIEITERYVSFSIFTESRQLCEALLRATGKWKE